MDTMIADIKRQRRYNDKVDRVKNLMIQLIEETNEMGSSDATLRVLRAGYGLVTVHYKIHSWGLSWVQWSDILRVKPTLEMKPPLNLLN